MTGRKATTVRTSRGEGTRVFAPRAGVMHAHTSEQGDWALNGAGHCLSRPTPRPSLRSNPAAARRATPSCRCCPVSVPLAENMGVSNTHAVLLSCVGARSSVLSEREQSNQFCGGTALPGSPRTALGKTSGTPASWMWSSNTWRVKVPRCQPSQRPKSRFRSRHRYRTALTSRDTKPLARRLREEQRPDVRLSHVTDIAQDTGGCDSILGRLVANEVLVKVGYRCEISGQAVCKGKVQGSSRLHVLSDSGVAAS